MSGLTNSDGGSESKKQIDRRRVLKTSAASFSAVSTIGIPVSATTSDDEVEIVAARHGDEVVRTESVPQNWWAYEQKADRIQDRLQARYKKSDTVTGIGIGTVDERIANRKKSSVIVFTKSSEGRNRVLSEVPDFMENVPIKVKNRYEPNPDGCNQHDFNYVPGGVQGEGDHSSGSLTCPVKNSSGTKGMMTAAHLFHGSTCEDVTGEILDQHDQRIGDVTDYVMEDDWVFAPKDAGASEIDGFSNSIADVSGSIVGHVTRSGLKDLKSAGTTVYHQGKSTCKTSGQVKEVDIDVSVCDNLNSSNYVKMSTPTEKGDSGGPHFNQYEIGGEWKLEIIAPHHGGESVGCGAYHINEYHGYTFGI